jgi:hypothetical protein
MDSGLGPSGRPGMTVARAELTSITADSRQQKLGDFAAPGGRIRTVNKYIRFYRGFAGFHEIRTYPQRLKLSSNCHGAIIER